MPPVSVSPMSWDLSADLALNSLISVTTNVTGSCASWEGTAVMALDSWGDASLRGEWLLYSRTLDQAPCPLLRKGSLRGGNHSAHSSGYVPGV